MGIKRWQKHQKMEPKKERVTAASASGADKLVGGRNEPKVVCAQKKESAKLGSSPATAPAAAAPSTSTQKRPGGPAAAAPPKRQNMADDEDEDPGFDEEAMLAMEEEMADEAGQDVDGPAPPDEAAPAAPAATPAAATAEAHDGAATDEVAEYGAEPAPAPVSDIVEHLNKLLAEQKSAPAPQTKEKTGLLTDEELTAQHAIDESQMSDCLSKALLARKTARLNAAPALAPVPTPAELARKAASHGSWVHCQLSAPCCTRAAPCSSDQRSGIRRWHAER